MKNIPRDKLLHFVVSALLALSISSILSNVLINKVGSATVVSYVGALMMTLGVGVLKELRDRKEAGNHFYWNDLVADVTGAVFGSLGAFVTYLQ